MHYPQGLEKTKRYIQYCSFFIFITLHIESVMVVTHLLYIFVEMEQEKVDLLVDLGKNVKRGMNFQYIRK